MSRLIVVICLLHAGCNPAGEEEEPVGEIGDPSVFILARSIG